MKWEKEREELIEIECSLNNAQQKFIPEMKWNTERIIVIWWFDDHLFLC